MDWSFKPFLESSAHKKGLILPRRESNSILRRILLSLWDSEGTALVQQLSVPKQLSKSPFRCTCSPWSEWTKWHKGGGSSSATGWWDLYQYHLPVSDTCWDIWKTQPRSERELLKLKLDLNSDPFLSEMPGNPDPHPRYLAWTQNTFN